MTVKQQWLVVAAIVGALGAGAYTASRLLSDELTQITVGSRAPDFNVVTVTDGPPEPRTMASYRGNVILLNIWATWCTPCRQEMPAIQALHADMESRGLKVVAVSIDAPGSEQNIRDFAKELGLTFEIVFDTAGVVSRTYRTTGVPETFVIARDGTIRKKFIGPDDWNSADNRALIELLLAENAH